MRSLPFLVVTAIIAGHPALAAESHHKHNHASPYAGEQTRDIKALSREDVEELLRGGGRGLAKAAELNGVPGPTHVLDMAGELGLSAEQTDSIRRVRDDMRRDAKALGERFVASEAELEARFRSDDIAEAELGIMVRAIEALRAELRIAHLAAHIRVAGILTRDQIDRYASLRGYR